MNEYTSLSQMRTYLSLGSNDTADDAVIRSFIGIASRMIDKETRCTFYPKRVTLVFDDPPDSQFLHFNEQLVLEVAGLSDLAGASEIDSSAYFLSCGDTYNLSPYDSLTILSNSGSGFKYSGTPQRSVRVDAVVGYHEDYSNAWVNSGASLTSLLGADVTLASVSGSAGENEFGISPRFDTEQILRIGGGTPSEEYIQIMDTSPTTDGSVIRVRRGINGTTAASHAASATIEVFDIEPDIVFCTRLLTAWIYEKSQAPFTNKIAMPSMGVIEIPSAWPNEVKERLRFYKKSKISSVGF